jgi:hypothetical protein
VQIFTLKFWKYDLAPSDFYLLSDLRKHLKGRKEDSF